MMNVRRQPKTPAGITPPENRRQLRIVVIGSLRDVPIAPKRCAKFVDRLGEIIVGRNHTLMTGCRGSLDRAIAKAAVAWLESSGRSPEQLVSFLPRKAVPVHEFGIINRSYVTDWEDISRPDATPPEQIARCDVIICVAGSEGTCMAATWARFAGKPVLGVAQFGGAGQELYRFERDKLPERPWGFVGIERFDVLNRVTDDVVGLAEATISLAEEIVFPRAMFVAMSFGREFLQVYRAVEGVAKELDFHVERIDFSKSTERIIPRIHTGIRRSAFVVADVSTASPNVFYELGYAQALGRPVITTAKRGTRLPFDIVDLPVVFWDRPGDLTERLPELIRAAVTTLAGFSK
jgi:hypothetical protein